MTRDDQDPDLQYESALKKLTREKAFMILAAIKADGKLNTLDMIEHLDPHLGNTMSLGDLVQRTARGENALLDLLNKLALEIGERQAEKELAERARTNRGPSIDERIFRYLGERGVLA